MKEHYLFVEKDELLYTDEIQEMTELVNKRQGVVNFTVEDSNEHRHATAVVSPL